MLIQRGRVSLEHAIVYRDSVALVSARVDPGLFFIRTAAVNLDSYRYEGDG